MPTYYYFLSAASDQQFFQSVQAVIALITVSLGSGGAITIAIKQLLDTGKVKIIVELQGEIKSLQRESKYRENTITRLEAENSELRGQIDLMQEKSTSWLNEQLLAMQEKNNSLMLSYKKAVRIIKKLEGDFDENKK